MTTVSAPPEVTIGPDRLGRSLRDVRISVTDRCNFRCPYCMPKARFGPGHRFLPRAEALDAREIVRLAGVFASLGVTKIRLTGGEPLLRPDLVEIVEGIAKLGVPDIALTTNGALLRRWAFRLRDAGLQRVTVSLDSLDPAVFASMSDSRIEVSEVLDGIAAAREAGLAPIKLNCVVQRGVNEHGLLDLVDFARREGLSLRCIEYMDVGATNGWRMADVVSGEEILERVRQVYPLLEEAPDPSVGGPDISIRGRQGRPRRDHLGEPPLLRRLHACSSRCRWQAVHVPVRDRRRRPARAAAVGRRRRRAASHHRRSVEASATIDTPSCAGSASPRANASRCRTSAADRWMTSPSWSSVRCASESASPRSTSTATTVQEVWDELVRRHPAAALDAGSVRAARNLGYCEWSTAVIRAATPSRSSRRLRAAASMNRRCGSGSPTLRSISPR